MNNLWTFVLKKRLSAAECAKKFDFPQEIEGLLREKVFGGQDILELVGICVANHTRCRNQHEMYGLASGSFGGKHRQPVHHFLHIFISQRSMTSSLRSISRSICTPFSSSFLRVETHEQALLTMPLMPKASFI